MKQVLICGDGFRAHHRLVGFKSPNVDILAALIEPPIAAVGGKVSRIYQFDTDPHTAFILEDVLGKGHDVISWAYRSQVLTPAIRQFYQLVLDKYDFIVAFEAPLSMIRYCADKNIPLIDVAIHPIRFLDDLLLMARSSLASIDAQLKAASLNLGQVPLLPRFTKSEIIAAKEMKLRLQKAAGENGKISVLFLQSRFDKSKFDGEGGFVDDLAVLTRSELQPTFFKPHPNETRPELLLLMDERRIHSLPRDVGVYPLLALCGDILEVQAISSSVLVEAKALGVSSIIPLCGFPWNVEGFPQFSSRVAGHYPTYYTMGNIFYAREFWSCMLWNEAPKHPFPLAQLSIGRVRQAWAEHWGAKK